MKSPLLILIAALSLTACGQNNCPNPSPVTSVANCSQVAGHTICDLTALNGYTERVMRVDNFAGGMLEVGDSMCTR